LKFYGKMSDRKEADKELTYSVSDYFTSAPPNLPPQITHAQNQEYLGLNSSQNEGKKMIMMYLFFQSINFYLT
jgi:hypothetical protein